MNKTTNEEKKEKDKEGFNLWKNISAFIKSHVAAIIIFTITFGICVGIIYVDKSTNETVDNVLNEAKVGKVWLETDYKSPRTVKKDGIFPMEISKGEVILEKGAVITEEQVKKLTKLANSHDIFDYRTFANSVLLLMLISVFSFLLFSHTLLGRKLMVKEHIFMAVLFLLVFALTVFGCKWLGITSFSSDNICSLAIFIPSVLCAFLVAILFGQRTAFHFSLIVSFGVLCAARFQIIPAVYTLASSIAAFRIVRKIERRTDMVFASIMVAVLNVVFIIAVKVIFFPGNTPNFLSDFYKVLPGVAFNGFISGIFVLGLLTPLESLLNTASVFRLMDLSDLNTPMMRKLLLTAGGTYSHSMIVAQLAENACKKIGANSLVARVGAYYHDIGKMDHPEYFVENQSGENKHDDINPSLSASVIKSHVKLGIEKAHQLHLPKQIVDIISEHHGNSLIAYFYNEAKNKDSNVSPEDFSYPGNPPTSKESAVVMIADTVEAACRTLDKPSVSRLEKFIQQLINGKIEHHQLDNCALSFGELTLIKESFVQILAGYYHSRIEYPDQKDPDSNNLSDKTIEEAKNNHE